MSMRREIGIVVVCRCDHVAFAEANNRWHGISSLKWACAGQCIIWIFNREFELSVLKDYCTRIASANFSRAITTMLGKLGQPVTALEIPRTEAFAVV